MPITPEQLAERRKIMDRGTNMMDAIAKVKGEDHPDFWAAMKVTVDSVADFDKRHGIATTI